MGTDCIELERAGESRQAAAPKNMKITMIGHSSVLIETAGMRILTDPWFGGGNMVYSRVNPAARSRESLADVDLVLVSHNHFDHADGAYLKLLPEKTPVLAPSRTAWVTKLRGAKNVIGLAAWEQKAFGGLRITAVPAHHSTVTHGYVLQSGAETTYFAADTYYGKFMERVASEFHPKVVLMPVASFRLPPTMRSKGALQAAKTLSPEVIIPIHLGITPRNPLLRTAETPETFQQMLKNEGLGSQVRHLHEGEIFY